MRVLHAIHDFLPRHRAGSEIYAYNLAREIGRVHDVWVLAAEYDPSTAHGTLRWRTLNGLTIIELVNNWEFDRFADSYRSPRVNAQLAHVLDATLPDVLHVHNLLNLSFDLPRLAHERGIPVVATLHDYTLLCASGGQRVHVAESHVCQQIDPERCSRCFAQSPFAAQMGAARLMRTAGGSLAARAALWMRQRVPKLAATIASKAASAPATPADLRQRLGYARAAFDHVDLFVAPSRAIAEEFERFGVPSGRLEVSDYGFPAWPSAPARHPASSLRIGFVGTLVWHKGMHVLLEAARSLTGGFEIHVHGATATFPSYTGRLRAGAEGLPVTFHDGFDPAQAPEVFAGLDVLVVPSLWPENSPLVIHEAFMSGVPVVGAKTGGIPELVRHGVNGFLFDPFSPADLAACLQPLIDRPAAIAALASAIPPVKRIEDDAAEWLARYAQVVAGRASELAALTS